MSKTPKFERPEKFRENFDQKMCRCTCGHRVYIRVGETKALCDWCNKYVFRTKKDEFLYRTKERMNKKR